jgi:hypothetical protein
MLQRIFKIDKELAESRSAEEKTTTPPAVVVQAYPVKHEAFLLAGR